MKKHIISLLLICFTVGTAFSQNKSEQFKEIEINYSVEEINNNGELTYNLTVTTENVTSLKYYLYENSPIKENLIKKTKTVQENTYLFKDLTAGKYFVIAFKDQNTSGIKSIELGK